MAWARRSIAIESGKHDTIGIDLVAMCVSESGSGREPLFFLDYLCHGAAGSHRRRGDREGMRRDASKRAAR